MRGRQWAAACQTQPSAGKRLAAWLLLGAVPAGLAQCDEPLTYTNKAGKEVTKRVMHLADKSGKSIEATVFGSGATDDRPQAHVSRPGRMTRLRHVP